jgi:hypothetical protein
MRNIVHTKKLLQDNRRGLRKSIASNQRRIMLPTNFAIVICKGKRVVAKMRTIVNEEFCTFYTSAIRNMVTVKTEANKQT